CASSLSGYRAIGATMASSSAAEKIRSCAGAAGVSLAVAAGLLAGGASGLFSREQLLASSNMADTAQATRVRIRNPREGGGHLPGFNRGSALPVAQWDFGPDLRTPECSNDRTSSISAKKKPRRSGALVHLLSRLAFSRRMSAQAAPASGSEIHAAHAAHAAAAMAAAHRLFLLRQLRHHRFGGDHEAGDGSRVLQRGAGDLGRVQDAHGNHVAVLAAGGVVAVAAGTLLDVVQ